MSLVNTLRTIPILSIPCEVLFSALEVKMGSGGQDEPAGKSGITSDEKRATSS